MTGKIVVLGVFVTDTSYRADRAPKIGETILGNSFALGPGGKGSNQSVAAARAGADVHFISRLGRDAFADMAMSIWADSGVNPEITMDDAGYTGAAYVFIEEASGNNAIIICPGVANDISVKDIEDHAGLIKSASVFMTQLEQPLEAARRGLEIAKSGGAITILNPAPAADLPDSLLHFCDILTPNETEAEALTGQPVKTVKDANEAAKILMNKGVSSVAITLGENGVFYKDTDQGVHIPAITAGPVVETTGAGDAFNGGLATALSQGLNNIEAVRFGCATAGLSVTRPGTAGSMPSRIEIDALLAR